MKRPSGANSKSRQPESPIFFLDRSLGQQIVAAALRESGIAVEVHDDHFPQNAPDEEWLREVGARGWIVLTKDSKIRYRPAEMRSLLSAKTAVFVLSARGDLSGKEMADIFVSALPRMHRFIKKNSPPFLAGISRDGIVRVLS